MGPFRNWRCHSFAPKGVMTGVAPTMGVGGEIRARLGKAEVLSVRIGRYRDVPGSVR